MLINFVVYPEYAKAFDKVPHNVIINKRDISGFADNFPDLITSYLNSTRENVSIHEQFSIPLNVLRGLPQASSLDSPCFLTFSIDLPSISLDATAWLFADDFEPLFTTANFHDDITRLHNCNITVRFSAKLSKIQTTILGSTTDGMMNTTTLENVFVQKKSGYSNLFDLTLEHSL